MKGFTAGVTLDEWLELHPWRERRFAIEGNKKKKKKRPEVLSRIDSDKSKGNLI